MSRPTVRDRIIAALRGTGRPMSLRAVARRLGYDAPPPEVKKHLEDLVAAGHAVTCNGCEACGSGRKYAIAKEA